MILKLFKGIMKKAEQFICITPIEGLFFCKKLFFAEAKCRLVQNAMHVGCCKQSLGATPPSPSKINGCDKLRPTFTPSVDSAITYKPGLQLYVFYFCNKHKKLKKLYFYKGFPVVGTLFYMKTRTLTT